MVVPVLLLTIGAAAVLLGSRRRGPRSALNDQAAVPTSPVAFQHLQLFQGGLLSQVDLAAAKADLLERLDHEEPASIESTMRPGLDYIVKVRALTEIGTEQAACVLERQLGRRLAADPIEQAWYWFDLAQALRGMNHGESLPALLRCAEGALDSPLGPLFAAEVSAFPQFADYLMEPLTRGGQTALRVLRCAMEGIRRGYVPVTLFAEAQVGEMVRRLAESCPDNADPLIARLFIEALRHARRSYTAYPELKDDPLRRQVVRWQTGYLRDAEPILREYLHEIEEDLADLLPRCGNQEQADILSVLAELHADAGDHLIELLDDELFTSRPAGLAALQWSKAPEASSILGELIQDALHTQPIPSWWRRKAVAEAVSTQELLAALKALRGHPGEDSESILLVFTRQTQPILRVAAMQSLGWHEPIQRTQVLQALHAGRMEANADIRRAAIGALARLGEVAALSVLRDSLNCKQVEIVHQTIDVVAQEGLSWLWPELDLMTEHDDGAIAHHAWEAIEELRELVLSPLA